MKALGNGRQELVEVSGKTLGWLAQMAGVTLEGNGLGDGIVCCRPNPAIGGYSCVNERGEVIWNAAGYVGPIPRPCPPGGAPPPPRATPPAPPGPPRPRPVPPAPGGGGAPPMPRQGVNPTSPAPAVPSCCRAYWNDHNGVWYMACNDGKRSMEVPVTAAAVADWNNTCSQGGQPGGGGAGPAPTPGPVLPLPLPPGTAPLPLRPPPLRVPPPERVLPGPIPGGFPPGRHYESPGPLTVGVRLEVIEKLLSSVEDGWQTAMRLVVRADRCSATDAEKAARDQALACLEAYKKAAGQLRPALNELCQAKKSGRNANLNAGQVQALEALAICVSKITAASVQAATSSGPDWLRAVVGTVLPAAGSILVAVA